MHPWLQTLSQALLSEHEHRERELKRALSSGLEERVALGVSWPTLEVVDVEWSRRGPRILLKSRGSLHDGLQAGDPVTLSPVATTKGLPGMLLDSQDRQAQVLLSCEQLPAWAEAGRVVLSRRLDPRALSLSMQGLSAAQAHDSPLKKLLLGERPISEPLPAAAPPQLNPAQAQAARLALGCRELALIHGPPGTGKTYTLARIAQALVEEGERPWALADSNAATDHLATTLQGLGVHLVRLGHPARMRPEVRALSLDAQLTRGPYAHALALLDKEIRQAARLGNWRDRRSLLRERRALATQARAQVLDGAQVIVSTLGTMARRVGTLPPVETALIDEATQAQEPSIWALIPHVERLILTGDPKQLGPVVTQVGNPLERSMVDRLIEQQTAPMPMLEEQHRMGCALASLVQDVYGPAYRPSPAVAARSLDELISPPSWAQSGVFFLDTAGAGMEEQVDQRTRSTHNPGEVTLVAELTSQLLSVGLRPDQLVLLAPYRAQVDAMRAHSSLQGLRVATLNAWQGREEEVVLCSFVRSNTQGRLGFVADPRRLTVALSRARRLFVGVGDSATLSNHPRFRALIDRLAGHDQLHSIWSAPWSKLIP